MDLRGKFRKNPGMVSTILVWFIALVVITLIFVFRAPRKHTASQATEKKSPRLVIVLELIPKQPGNPGETTINNTIHKLTNTLKNAGFTQFLILPDNSSSGRMIVQMPKPASSDSIKHLIESISPPPVLNILEEKIIYFH